MANFAPVNRDVQQEENNKVATRVRGLIPEEANHE